MVYKREDWNDLLAAVNDVLENPPEETDCSDTVITPLPPELQIAATLLPVSYLWAVVGQLEDTIRPPVGQAPSNGHPARGAFHGVALGQPASIGSRVAGSRDTFTYTAPTGRPGQRGGVPRAMQLFDPADFDLYDPDLYKLTLPDGRALVIHQHQGLQSITDLNGNVLSGPPPGALPTYDVNVRADQIVVSVRA